MVVKQQEQCSLTFPKCLTSSSSFFLFEKLSHYGIQDNELKWFTDYLFLWKQVIRLEEVLSEPDPVFTGVPQGSILGPLLFLIHYNDVQKPLCYSKDLDAIQLNLGKDINSLASWLWENELIINLKREKLKKSSLEQQKQTDLMAKKWATERMNLISTPQQVTIECMWTLWLRQS